MASQRKCFEINVCVSFFSAERKYEIHVIEKLTWQFCLILSFRFMISVSIFSRRNSPIVLTFRFIITVFSVGVFLP